MMDQTSETPLPSRPLLGQRMLVLLNSKACRGEENIRPILDRFAAAGFSLLVESSLAKGAVTGLKSRGQTA